MARELCGLGLVATVLFGPGWHPSAFAAGQPDRIPESAHHDAAQSCSTASTACLTLRPFLQGTNRRVRKSRPLRYLAPEVAGPEESLGGEHRSVPDRDRVAVIERLYAEKRWQEIVRDEPASPSDPGEIDYYRGMAFARLGRFDEARQALQTGQKKQPDDKRFPIELAGVAFKQKQFAEARRNLRQALRLDPKDAYTIDFLATVELLNQNLEAALELWNRSVGGKIGPKIEEVRFDSVPRTDPVLLDHAFAFAPASVLKFADYRTTEARLALLGVFSHSRFELTPRLDTAATQPGQPGQLGKSGRSNKPEDPEKPESFDLVFHAKERNGWGDSKLGSILSLLRGLPYETVYPEYFNFRGSATNFTSLVRWDRNKQRLFASLSAPLQRDPSWRTRFYVDLRNENWEQTFRASGTPFTNLNVQKIGAGAEIRSVVNGHWSWNTGVDGSNRWFRNRQGPSGTSGFNRFDTAFFSHGVVLKYRAGLDHLLLDRPQDRLTVRWGISQEVGRFFVTPSNFFSKTRGSALVHWFPQPRGDDYELSGQFRAGKTQGRVPLDELFVLGLERDNDLPLRAHVGTQNGKKGSAPLGRDYVLANWEIDKRVYEGKLFDVRLAPFLDTGRTFDASANFGSRVWLWDTGGQVKLRLLGGLTAILTYGKDLRSGRNATYATIAY